MKVLFAPDWRNGVPYQQLLAEALRRQGVEVDYLCGYKRVMPLTRLLAQQRCDILHLHWPEAYYPRKGDAFDAFRRARFATDLRGALRHCKLATTAHNLHAHNRPNESFAHRNTCAAHTLASVVFAHSEIGKQQLISEFSLPPEKISIIPNGDLSCTLGEPLSQSAARRALDLPAGPLAIIFGAVEPYKGQEEIIAWWKRANPGIALAIIGNPISPDYAAHITATIGDTPGILTRFGWLPDDQLRLWLSAADVAVFNYRQIFNSGAANLARTWGLPLVLPARLETVILGEPTPFVHRFADIERDLAPALRAALSVAPDFAAAAAWRAECSWARIAHLTAEGYRRALNSPLPPHREIPSLPAV